MGFDKGIVSSIHYENITHFYLLKKKSLGIQLFNLLSFPLNCLLPLKIKITYFCHLTALPFSECYIIGIRQPSFTYQYALEIPSCLFAA